MGSSEIIWDAEDYNKSNGSQYRDAKETIDLIIKETPDKSDLIVVDIGCGSGNVTKQLIKALPVKKIFASDFDEKMVEYAKEKYNDKKIEYFTQDISVPWDLLDERLKNLEGKVDLIWSNRVLHWVPDKSTAVKTIARLLKPGGRCYVNITLFRNCVEFLSKEGMEKNGKYFYFESHESQTEKWNLHFKNSGLSDVNIEFLEKHWIFDNQEQKDQMYSCYEPYLYRSSQNGFNELSDEEKKRSVSLMIQTMTKATQTPFGKNPETYMNENALFSYYEQFRVIGIK